jgi:hypothetical protein
MGNTVFEILLADRTEAEATVEALQMGLSGKLHYVCAARGFNLANGFGEQ